MPRDGPFRFDSAVAFPDAVEAIYRHEGNGSDHLWLTAAAPDGPLAPPIPPEPADQPAATRTAVESRGTTVHYAALDDDWGGWEAFWARDGVRYAAWASPSTFLDGDGFRALLDSLAR